MYYINIIDNNENLVILNLNVLNKKLVLFLDSDNLDKNNRLLVRKAEIKNNYAYLEVDAYDSSLSRKYFSRDLEIFGDIYVSQFLQERSYEVEGLKIENLLNVHSKKKNLHK